MRFRIAILLGILLAFAGISKAAEETPAKPVSKKPVKKTAKKPVKTAAKKKNG